MQSEPPPGVTAGNIVLGSYRLYRQHFLVLFVIANVFTPIFASVPLAHATGAIGADALRWLSEADILLRIVAVAAVAAAVVDVNTGRQPSFRRSYGCLVSRLGALALAAARVAGSVFLVFAVMAIPLAFVARPVADHTSIRGAVILGCYLVVAGAPAMWMLVRWSLFVQTVVIGRTTGWKAPGQSAALVAGNWWWVAIVYVLLWLAEGGPALSALVRLAPGPELLIAVVGIVTGALVWPVFAIGQSLLYLGLSARKEETPAAV